MNILALLVYSRITDASNTPTFNLHTAMPEGLLSPPTSTVAAQTISMRISILLNVMQMTVGCSQLVRMRSRWLWWICCCSQWQVQQVTLHWNTNCQYSLEVKHHWVGLTVSHVHTFHHNFHPVNNFFDTISCLKMVTICSHPYSLGQFHLLWVTRCGPSGDTDQQQPTNECAWSAQVYSHVNHSDFSTQGSAAFSHEDQESICIKPATTKSSHLHTINITGSATTSLPRQVGFTQVKRQWIHDLILLNTTWLLKKPWDSANPVRLSLTCLAWKPGRRETPR